MKKKNPEKWEINNFLQKFAVFLIIYYIVYGVLIYLYDY